MLKNVFHSNDKIVIALKTKGSENIYTKNLNSENIFHMSSVPCYTKFALNDFLYLYID